jgi:hypothetical protein
LIYSALVLFVIGPGCANCFSQAVLSEVQIRFVEMKFRKPPLVDLYFDVTLRNNSSEPKWFLLPSNLGQNNQLDPATGGVDAVEVFAPKSKNRVLIGHFLGTGGFHALQLAGGAEVRLRDFAISFWGEPPDQLAVSVIIAKQLNVGGESAATWFGVDPLISGKADTAEDGERRTRAVHSRRAPNSKEVSTLIEESSRVELTVALKTKH